LHIDCGIQAVIDGAGRTIAEGKAAQLWMATIGIRRQTVREVPEPALMFSPNISVLEAPSKI
jgi:hypothetical protein